MSKLLVHRLFIQLSLHLPVSCSPVTVERAFEVGLTESGSQPLLDLLKISQRDKQRLVIGLVTVNFHVRSIYSKLGVTSRSAATRYALEHHLL